MVVWRNAFNRPNHFFAPYPGSLCEEDFKTFFEEGSAQFVK
jgi:mannan endo-1,4-beta-mannosidase